MGWWSSLFGGKKDAAPAAPEPQPSSASPPPPPPQPPPPPWPYPAEQIAGTDNPWGCELFNVRQSAREMISMSRDLDQVGAATGWRYEDGRSFIGQLPSAATPPFPCELTFQLADGAVDGRWFRPEVMEEKWALFHYDNRLYFVRSWTRVVVAVAVTERSPDKIVIRQVIGYEGLPSDLLVQIVDFVIKSHVLGTEWPAPLPQGTEPLEVAPYCFHQYGRRAYYASFASLLDQPVHRAIRVDTPLFMAIERSEEAAALARLKEAPAEATVPSRDHGYLPLHGAAVFGMTEAIAALLKAGAEVNARSGLERTPLHDGASYAKTKVEGLRLLVEAGADVRAKDREGAEPIHLAAKTGTAEVIRFLVERGADPNSTITAGFVPLHHAAETGRIENMEALVQAGARVNEARGEHTALSFATAKGHTAAVEWLKAHGAIG